MFISFFLTTETKEKSIPRENSTSDSEENSAIKDLDQQSVGDTDNQVCWSSFTYWSANVLQHFVPTSLTRI